ncbi:MAG: elongation factor P [Deltaproteobacteria bacterium]|nr:elongation factor P [Deltaproteobacteria bacterium]
MITTSDFKRGVRIQIDGEPFVITDVHVQPPSARGASSLTKVKVRNLRTGLTADKTFRGGDKVEEPNVELRPVQFLYQDRDGYHFMDTQSYDQFALAAEDLGDATGYLIEGLADIRSVLFNDAVISIELPNTVELEIVDTAPVVKGASAQAQTKPAKLQTGLVVQVPSYLESGEVVKVDTREARYVSRGKKE